MKFQPLVSGAFFATLILARFLTDYDVSNVTLPQQQLDLEEPELEEPDLEGLDLEEPDLEEPDLWNQYAATGQTLWRQWEQKTGKDKMLMRSVPQMFRHSRWERGTCAVDSYTSDILEGLVPSCSLNDYDYDGSILFSQPIAGTRANPETPNHFGVYQSVVNVQAGAFISTFADRGEDMPARWQTPDVLWWQWYAGVGRHVTRTWDRQESLTESRHQAREDSLHLLDFYIIEDIMDEDLLEIVRYATKTSPANQMTPKMWEFEPSDQARQVTAFWALLGCPKVSVIIQLLTEHKQAMKGKGIISLRVYHGSEWEDDDSDDDNDVGNGNSKGRLACLQSSLGGPRSGSPGHWALPLWNPGTRGSSGWGPGSQGSGTVGSRSGGPGLVGRASPGRASTGRASSEGSSSGDSSMLDPGDLGSSGSGDDLKYVLLASFGDVA